LPLLMLHCRPEKVRDPPPASLDVSWQRARTLSGI
jgi:hypothetical protein